MEILHSLFHLKGRCADQGAPFLLGALLCCQRPGHCLLVWLQASMVKCDSPFSLITSLQYTFNWSFQHHPIKLALSSTLMHWGFFSSFYRLLINRCSHLSCFVHCANHTLPMSKCRPRGLKLTLIVLLLLGFKSIFFHIFWVSSLFTNVFCKSFL